MTMKDSWERIELLPSLDGNQINEIIPVIPLQGHSTIIYRY